MMLVFMTLFELVLCIDCWCVVDLLSTMTSVLSWVLLLYLPPPCEPFPYAQSNG
jgi:hypothetical protein